LSVAFAAATVALDDAMKRVTGEGNNQCCRYCFREESGAREFQRLKPNLIKIIEFQAHVGYVKRVSASIVSGNRAASPTSPATPLRRAQRGPSAMELIYNYSHYMYGAVWVADDSLDGEKGTVRCLHERHQRDEFRSHVLPGVLAGPQRSHFA
jgi:hypothetical protein